MIKEFINNTYNLDLDNGDNKSLIVKYDLNRNIIWKNYIFSNPASSTLYCGFLDSVKDTTYLYSAFYANSLVTNIIFSGNTINETIGKTSGKVALGFCKIGMTDGNTKLNKMIYVNPSTLWTCKIYYNSNHIYLYGIFNDEIIIEGNTISKIGQNIYLIKYDITGNLQWYSTFGGRNLDYVTDLKIYNSSLYMSGYYNLFTELDSYDLQSIGSTSSFVVKIDIDTGKCTSLYEKYSDDELKIKSLEFINGSMFIIGEFKGNVKFGTTDKYSQHLELFVEEIKMTDSKWQI